MYSKVCKKCLQPFEASAKAQRWCTPCGIARRRERDRVSAAKRHHGLPHEEYERLRLLGCAICGVEFQKTPHVDHDHSHCAKKIGCKECVRGLLCGFCNTGFIYAIENNPALRLLVSQHVLDYLDKIKKQCPTSSSR